MANAWKNTNQVISELRKFGNDVESKIELETEQAAKVIEEDAKKLAPVDNGFLQQQIAHLKVKEMQYKITVNAPYAAYIEFGTGTKVKVPPEFADIAASFKGKTTGTFEKGLEAITEWCKRHGIPEKNAKWIFLRILGTGINPHPFLYPAWSKGKNDYLNNLKKMLKQLNKKI